MPRSSRLGSAAINERIQFRPGRCRPPSLLWHPEQAVSRVQVSLWMAVVAFEEKDKGTLKVGKLADLTYPQRR